MPISDATVFTIIQDTWAATVGFEIDRLPGHDVPPVDAYIVCVKLTGTWDGEVRLYCSRDLGRAIGASMFRTGAENVNDYEVLDALSELIHIVGGNLKFLLPKPIQLSLPSLLNPADWANTTPQWQMICSLTLASKGFPFVVSLLGDYSASTRPRACPEAELLA